MTCDTVHAIFRVFTTVCICFAFAICGCEDPNATDTAAKPFNPRNVPYAGNKPKIAIGGGGGSVDTSVPEKRTTESNESAAPPAISTVSNIEGGLANGLFPQTAANFSQTGFGGGLVPDFQNPASAEQLGIDEGGAEVSEDSDLGEPQGEQSEVSQISPQGFFGQAIDAFRERNESDGFKYLYAHVLTDDDAGTRYPLDWYSGISEPKIAFRWGVGVSYTSPRDFEGRPPVIGDPEDVKLSGTNSSAGNSGRGRGIGAAGGGGGTAGTEDSPYENVDTSQNEGFLLYYTGDFGDRLLTRLEARRMHDSAYYGKLLRDLGDAYLASSDSPSRGNAPRNTNAGRGRSIGAAGGGSNSGGGSDGVVGTGGGGNSGGGATTGPRLDRVSGSSAAADPDSSQTGTLIPGVMLLGEGDKNTLLERAKEMGLDGLLIFQTRVSSGRKPKGSAILKIFNVKTGEEKFKSRNLASDTVAKTRERKKDEKTDPVALALDGVFKEMLDQKYKATPIGELKPELKPEHAAKRVKSLMGESFRDPLSVAVEVMSFRRMGLLDVDQTTQALNQILGEGAGDALLAGDVAARQAAIIDFLPTSSASDSDSGFR